MGWVGQIQRLFPVERRLICDLKEMISAYMWSESIQHYFQVQFQKTKTKKEKFARLSFTWGQVVPSNGELGMGEMLNPGARRLSPEVVG